MKLSKRAGLFFVLLMIVMAGCTAKSTPDTPAMDPELMAPASLDAVKAYEEEDYRKSLELYQSLVATDKTNHVNQNNLGVLLLKGGRNGEALDAFESASLFDPQNVEYLVNVAFAQLRIGERDEALSFFDRALQLDPQETRAVYGKGVTYLFMNEPEVALGLFLQAVKTDPSNPEYLFMKAYASQKTSLWMDAIKDYTAFLGLSKDKWQRANALSNRGLCYFRLEDYKAGVADLQAAIEINDASGVFYYNLAQGHEAQHDYEAAVKDYTRAISRKSSFPEAYINRGELNFYLDNKAKGCADLRRACDLGVCEPWDKYESLGQCKE